MSEDLHRLPASTRIGDCIRAAWETFVDEPARLLVMGSIVHGASIVAMGLLDALPLLGLGLVFLGARPLRFGYAYLCLRSARGETTAPNDVLRPFRRYGDVVIADGLVFAAVVLGSLLLVVPGVFIYCRTRFVPYLVLDEGLGPVEAIQESFALTEGLTGTLFGVTVLGWIATGVGSVPVGLGIVPALIGWDLTLVALYRAACSDDDERYEWIDAPARA